MTMPSTLCGLRLKTTVRGFPERPAIWCLSLSSQRNLLAPQPDSGLPPFETSWSGTKDAFGSKPKSKREQLSLLNSPTGLDQALYSIPRGVLTGGSVSVCGVLGRLVIVVTSPQPPGFFVHFDNAVGKIHDGNIQFAN